MNYRTVQKELIFLADHMLANVSRWLNILGFPSHAAGDEMGDDDIIKECINLGSILLTKDRELNRRAQKMEIKSILLREKKIEDELLELFTKLDIKEIEFFKKELCAFCSSELETINKEKIKDRIPKGTYEKIDVYWICNQCNKLFWHGAHWDKIQKVANLLTKKLRSKNDSGVGGI